MKRFVHPPLGLALLAGAFLPGPGAQAGGADVSRAQRMIDKGECAAAIADIKSSLTQSQPIDVIPELKGLLDDATYCVAKGKDTVEAYDAYVAGYPRGIGASDATRRACEIEWTALGSLPDADPVAIEALVSKRATCSQNSTGLAVASSTVHRRAQEVGAKEALQAAMARYPNDPAAPATAGMIDDLDFEAAMASPDTEALFAFITSHPRSKHLKEAADEAHRRRLEAALTATDEPPLRAFLQAYPQDPQRGEVLARLRAQATGFYVPNGDDWAPVSAPFDTIPTTLIWKGAGTPASVEMLALQDVNGTLQTTTLLFPGAPRLRQMAGIAPGKPDPMIRRTFRSGGTAGAIEIDLPPVRHMGLGYTVGFRVSVTDAAGKVLGTTDLRLLPFPKTELIPTWAMFAPLLGKTTIDTQAPDLLLLQYTSPTTTEAALLEVARILRTLPGAAVTQPKWGGLLVTRPGARSIQVVDLPSNGRASLMFTFEPMGTGYLGNDPTLPEAYFAKDLPPRPAGGGSVGVAWGSRQSPPGSATNPVVPVYVTHDPRSPAPSSGAGAEGKVFAFDGQAAGSFALSADTSWSCGAAGNLAAASLSGLSALPEFFDHPAYFVQSGGRSPTRSRRLTDFLPDLPLARAALGAKPQEAIEAQFPGLGLDAALARTGAWYDLNLSGAPEYLVEVPGGFLLISMSEAGKLSTPTKYPGTPGPILDLDGNGLSEVIVSKPLGGSSPRWTANVYSMSPADSRGLTLAAGSSPLCTP